MSNQLMGSNNHWTRVVVLTPAASSNGTDGALSPQLKASFSQRDWFAVEQSNPYLAMAELCLRERAQAARAAWGLQRMEQLALVVLEPHRWPQLDELASAVSAYLPFATIWTVADHEVIPLGVPIVQPGQERPGTTLARVPEQITAVQPMMSSGVVTPARQGAHLKFGSANNPDESHDDSQRISRDEIEMLLRIDSGEGAA